jgi:adenylate cyclase class 2
MDSIEHETEVVDDIELEKIILHSGFTPYSDLTKTRQTAHLGEIEICIDTIKGLGDFIEVEKLTDENADYDVVAKELWTVLESFGVKRSDHVTDGYDVLMRKHEGLDS